VLVKGVRGLILVVDSNSKEDKIALIRDRAEQDLAFFIQLVHPQRVLGNVHLEVINWWTRDDSKSHQLLLLPRDHGKSAMVAYRVAWEIVKDPTIRVLYISSTANLATKQLKFIKDILASKTVRTYWPGLVHPEEGKREKWTETEISVDHPLRKAEAVRDPTVFTAGLTTGIVGLHCDIAVLDDVVVGENAHTEEGRSKVETQYSFLSSIEGANAREWVVGTRYHPNDLYSELLDMVVPKYDEDGELVSEEPLYEIFERQVEDVGDGTGEFLWPRQQRYDGKWFGFDQNILAKKRAQYLDKTQFRAQYYNDPNDMESAPINREWFQYYNRALVQTYNDQTYYNGHKLNVYAGIDFAYTQGVKSDYTAIVVVGVDANNNYYILDIERFKTDRIKEYFDKILLLHKKWHFKKIRAEVTSAQGIIVKDLKENYIKPYGLMLSIDEHKPNSKTGSKEERIHAALSPRYENLQMWHYNGGNCELLEGELVLQHPPHDDIKDCLAAVMDICVSPSMELYGRQRGTVNQYVGRFGGIG
jgi:phage terminase large subunit-like protein